MGKLPCSIFLIALAIWVTGPQVYAVLISVDADAYTPGTNISTIFDSVKLQTYYDNGQLTGNVYSRQAYDPVLASTGTNIFDHALTGTDAYGKPRKGPCGSRPDHVTGKTDDVEEYEQPHPTFPPG